MLLIIALEMMYLVMVVKFVIMVLHYLQTKPVKIAQKKMTTALIVLLMPQIIINAWNVNLDMVQVHLVVDVNSVSLRTQNNVK